MKHKKKGNTGRFLGILLAAVMVLSWLPTDVLSPAVHAEETDTGAGEDNGGAGAEKSISSEKGGNAVPPEESGTKEDDTEKPETEAGSTEEPDDGEKPGKEPIITEKKDTAACVCGTLCTADSANADCPVCGAEGDGIAGCKGEPEDAKNPESEDTEDVKNPESEDTENAKNPELEDTENPEMENPESKNTEQENIEQEDMQGTGLCRHHPEHTEDCAYTESTQENEGTPCTYECRICPIEDLILALPEKVTGDNAEDVRAQLDEILALYRNLTEKEQDQIDLTRCYELQAALDASGIPALTDDTDFVCKDNENGGVTITGYNGSGGDIEIPSTIGGKKVTCIGMRAFIGCTGLTGVKIPNSVISIEDTVFSGCGNLISVEIPGSVKSMGDGVFYNCTKLTKVEISEGVTSIGTFTFWNCTNLTSIEIPDSVTSIGDHAFLNCTNLESVEIPKNVTSIGVSAFSGCSKLKNIEIPDGVTSIEAYAFSGCTGLTSVKIPNSVTEIGDLAFSGCTKCECIYIPDGCSTASNAVPGRITQIRYKYDSTADSVTITEINLGTGKTSVVIPDTIAGVEVVSVAENCQSKVAENGHTHKVRSVAACTSKAACYICGEYGAALGHIYGVPVFTWGQNNKTCTALFTCERVNTHVETVNCTITSKITREATTEREGEVTYTAAVEINGTKYTDMKTGTIEKLSARKPAGSTTSSAGSAATEPPSERHRHDYTVKVTKEAACTEEGIRTYTCFCGDSYTERIPAPGHSYHSEVVRKSTVSAEGVMVYTCTRCGASYTEPIGKLKNTSLKPGEGPEEEQPFIRGASGKKGWKTIEEETEKAEAGSTVVVDMNGTAFVPGDVFESIRGRDVTIVFDMGNGIAWSVDGQSVSADGVDDIDFDLKTGTQTIPEELVSGLAGERYSIRLSLASEGEFGFTAVLMINLGEENAGYTANLYYYDKNAGGLEFICEDEIAEDGTAEFPFTHASDYIIVVDKKPETEDGLEAPQSESAKAQGTEDKSIPGENPDTDLLEVKTAREPWGLAAVGGLAVIIGIGTFPVLRKKNRKV